MTLRSRRKPPITAPKAPTQLSVVASKLYSNLLIAHRVLLGIAIVGWHCAAAQTVKPVWSARRPDAPRKVVRQTVAIPVQIHNRQKTTAPKRSPVTSEPKILSTKRVDPTTQLLRGQIPPAGAPIPKVPRRLTKSNRKLAITPQMTSSVDTKFRNQRSSTQPPERTNKPTNAAEFSLEMPQFAQSRNRTNPPPKQPSSLQLVQFEHTPQPRLKSNANARNANLGRKSNPPSVGKFTPKIQLVQNVAEDPVDLLFKNSTTSEIPKGGPSQAQPPQSNAFQDEFQNPPSFEFPVQGEPPAFESDTPAFGSDTSFESETPAFSAPPSSNEENETELPNPNEEDSPNDKNPIPKTGSEILEDAEKTLRGDPLPNLDGSVDEPPIPPTKDKKNNPLGSATNEGSDPPAPPKSDLAETNDQDCTEAAKACRSELEYLRRRQRTDISLDITPTIEPREFDMAKVEQIRVTKLSKSPTDHTWTDRRGHVIAEGQFEDFRDGKVVIRTLNGSTRSIPKHALSSQDRCYVNAWWELPEECTFEDEQLAMRDFRMTTFTWTASAACHKSLYFQDVALERYGHTAGPLIQPIRSGVHFFGNIAALPYHMGLTTPHECIYPLGYHRPGDCAPWITPGFPITKRSIKWQSMAIGAGIALLP